MKRNTDYKYKYFYKITNLVNEKIYYGIHRTNNLNDGYLGSGIALRSAIEKYGKQLFEKKILHFFDTEKELLKFEARIIDSDFVKQKNNYNLVEGGWSPSIQQRIRWWDSKDGQKRKTEYRKKFGGYKNPDFIKRWMPKYNSILDQFCHLVAETNLPDRYIHRQLTEKNHVKFWRVLRYAIFKGKINTIEDRYNTEQWFTQNSNLPVHMIKTDVLSDEYNCTPIIYKAAKPELLNQFNNILEVINDITISDSMIYNDLINLPNSRKIFTAIKYYQYLNLLKHKDPITINVRIRLPQSQRKKSIKTLFEPNNNYCQNYKLIGDTIEEEYSINFDGKTLSYSRI